jgi:hypothetical protein
MKANKTTRGWEAPNHRRRKDKQSESSTDSVAVLDYFPRVWGWVGELLIVHDAHLYLRGFMQTGLEPAVGEKWHPWVWHREAFHWLRFQDIAVFDSD